MGVLKRLQRRSRRDEATTEVVAYVFMFAIGATAMVFAVDFLTDTQTRGNEIAAAKQAEQLGQLTGSLVEQASRVAQYGPNATYNTTFELPEPVGDHNMTVEVRTEPWPAASGPCPDRAVVYVHSNSQRVSTSLTLGNVSTVQVDGDCLEFRGELDTSAEGGTVRYERSAETSHKPVVFVEPRSHKVT